MSTPTQPPRSSRSRKGIDEVADALRHYAGTPQAWLIGSPCFEPPVELQAAIREAAARPHFDYAPQPGLPELRQTIAEMHGRDGEEVAPDSIVVTNGAKCGLLAVLGALLEPGDEVLHPTPCYPAYSGMSTTLGARPIGMPEGDGDGFGWQVEALERRRTERTRVLVLSSPSNPTGSTLSGRESEMLVSFCRRHGIVLVCDETYEAFRFASRDEPRPDAFDPELQTVVRIRTFSKTYGVCGWRIGYVIAGEAIARRVVSFQAGALNPAGTLPQLALTRLPEVPAEFLEQARERVRDRLTRLHHVATSLGLRAQTPRGGFYLWVDIRHLLDTRRPTSLAWCRDLAAQQGLGLWPGEDFMASGSGCEETGWLRISAVANPMPDWSDALAELQARLERFIGG